MARNAAAVIENQFTAGLVTDATALSFPEHAVADVDNCRFHQRGFVERRCGIDLEHSFSTQTFANSPGAYSSFVWNAAANTTTNIAVVQAGAALYFYQIGTGTTSTGFIGTISLSTYLVSGSTAQYQNFECQYAAGFGYLFVVHPYLEPFFVTFDPVGIAVSATQISLWIRDFYGVDDGLGFDPTQTNNFAYPTSLSVSHHYNLWNQGWFNPNVQATNFGSWANDGSTSDPDYRVKQFHAGFSKYPSNSEIWFRYVVPFVSGNATYETFAVQPTVQTGTDIPSSQAPRGHYILNPFNQDRQTVSGLSTISVVTSNSNRPSTVAFFAGRVWYGGVQYQGFGNNLYFSQIVQVQNTGTFGYCYQQNDPTSQNFFNILDNDGGVITIQDAGQIIKLMPYGKFLVVFATNGVWSIGGSTGFGFKATDYSITRISAIPCISNTSFVDAGGTPMWWNEDGVYAIEPEKQSVQSLTDGKIKLFYNLIPYSCKQNARGTYNAVSKTVQWLYRDTSSNSVASSYVYDKILNLNLVTGAFDTWTLPTNTSQIVSHIVINRHIPESVPTVSVNPTTLQTAYILSSISKYVTIYPNGMSNTYLTFADERDVTYTDMVSVDSVGVDYTSFFMSGFQVHGDAQKKVQVNYVFLFTEQKLINSQMLFCSCWDFALDGTFGKWTPQELITWPNTIATNRKFHFYKAKLGGHGRVVSFRVTSVSGEPFNVVGWSSWETAGASP